MQLVIVRNSAKTGGKVKDKTEDKIEDKVEGGNCCWYCRSKIKKPELKFGIPVSDELIPGVKYTVKIKGVFHNWHCVVALMKSRRDTTPAQWKMLQTIFQVIFNKRKIVPSYDILLSDKFNGVLTEHQMSDHRHRIKFLNTFEE